MEEQKREEMKEENGGGIQENSFAENAGNELENAGRNLQEVVETETVEDENSSGGDDTAAGIPTRSLMLMVLGGIYLLYTGWRLCKNVMDGVEGASFGFMLAGIAFLVIGAGMLLIGGRGVIRNDKLRKAQEAAAAQEQQPQKTEADGEQPSQEVNKKMSIAERAKLTSRLEDEEEE